MEQIIEKIIAEYAPGDVITHSFLREQFNIMPLNMGDFDNTNDFMNEIQKQQFAYMNSIDELRDEMLQNERLYLKSLRGEGYTLMPPHEQVTFAYREAISDIKKTIKWAKSLMMFVKHENISSEQLAKDSELHNKLLNLAQIFNVKRN